MEKIKINHTGPAYGIQSITPVSEHVIRIVFAGSVPTEWGDIGVYTAGDLQCANLPGYDTVYRDEGQTVYLSDDGSVYTPPELPNGNPELPPEPYVPSEEELLAAAVSAKHREISLACEQAIYAGVDVTLSDGTMEHYSLTPHDQLNLLDRRARLAEGAIKLEYHADGQPCRFYDAQDMRLIITAASEHIGHHTAYCNSLNMWLAGCRTAEEVVLICYGAPVPEEYRSEILQTYLADGGDTNG